MLHFKVMLDQHCVKKEATDMAKPDNIIGVTVFSSDKFMMGVLNIWYDRSTMAYSSDRV